MIAAAMMLAAVSAKAQFEPGTFSIQPKVGLGVATITNMDDIYFGNNEKINNQVTASVLAGADLEYQATKLFSLAAGLNFSSQGTAWESFKMDGVKTEDPRIELTYINLPITANIYVAKGLALKAGVQFGFLTDAEAKFTTKGKIDKYDTEVNTSIDIKDDLKSMDISIPIGISYETKSHFVIDARYNLGLTKLNKTSFEGIKDNKNSMFMLTLGYKLKL